MPSHLDLQLATCRTIPNIQAIKRIISIWRPVLSCGKANMEMPNTNDPSNKRRNVNIILLHLRYGAAG